MPALDKKTLISIAILIVVTAVPFLTSLGNGFTNWDDQLFVTDNPLIREISWANVSEILSTFYKNDYRLLTVMFSYMLEYRFFGLDPFIYHLDNLLLHILNTVLVFYIVRRLTGAHMAALAAALLFGVHPIHVEAVSWVAERKGVLSGAFFLAAILLYLEFRTGPRKKLFYGLALAAFVLSMLSKLAGVSLPLVLLLIDYLQKRPIDKKALIEKIPFFVVSAAFALDTIYMYDTMEQLGSEEPLTTLQTALFAARNLFSYIRLTVWPTGLSAIYPFTVNISITDPAFFVPVILLAIITALVVYSVKYTRLVAFSALFTLVTLLPVLQVVGFASGDSVVSDRYMYIPSMGLLMLAGVLFERACSPKGQAVSAARVAMLPAIAVLATLVVVLSVATHKQALKWKDSETLWRHVIEVYPDLPRAHFNLADEYVVQKRYDEAISEYETVIELKVVNPSVHFNLGSIYAKLGRYDHAEFEFRTATTLNPNHVEAHFNRANALVRLGRIDDALSAYERAVALAPGRTNILNNQGIAYSLQGNYVQAARSFRAVLEIDPENEKAKKNLERVLKLYVGSQVQ